MSVENGDWFINGLAYDDPGCLRSPRELIEYVGRVGFLPLFGNLIPGFSVEEHTWSAGWWSGDPDSDPWEWREQLARSREVVYGKFFDKKAGFISLDWLPYFANFRRDGYDFDALYDDGLASHRGKKVMDLFMDAEREGTWKETALPSTVMKKRAGFGKDGEKNYPGVVTELQMRLYLVMTDFQRPRNKRGQEYGMAVSVLSPPEAIWGYDAVTAAYKEPPATSGWRIVEHIQKLYPAASERDIWKLIK